MSMSEYIVYNTMNVKEPEQTGSLSISISLHLSTIGRETGIFLKSDSFAKNGMTVAWLKGGLAHRE